MGNIAARLVMFSILLNLAAAITMTAVVDIDGQAIFNSTATTGFPPQMPMNIVMNI